MERGADEMTRKKRAFKTEVQQLMDLVVHSLYSKKEIYLRELISNASDAIDRLRYEGLTDASLLEAGETWAIRIAVDPEKRTLTVSDNGIGMNSEDLDAHLGTIANSGTRNFLAAMKEGQKPSDMEFIGQFGVGFYASFMVADEVRVVTRKAGSSQAWLWVSTGDGSYTVEEAEKAGRGTEVTLHLREDMVEFLQEWSIRQTVKRYSDYIAYPVIMKVREKGKDGKDGELQDETLNSMKALWKRARTEVSEEEYAEFYHHITHDPGKSLRAIHYAAEGAAEFRALLFVPEQAPFDLFYRDAVKGLQLYVRNVFITDDCRALMPEYLRFIRGVVDSSDLPLNVSREMLQDDAMIKRIRKSLVARVLAEFKEMKDAKRDDYLKFYGQFGRVLKEGLHGDYENREKLQELVLYPTTVSDGKLISVKEYVDRMPSAQKDVYYLVADSMASAEASPHLEAFKSRGYEVLLMTDPVDSWVAMSMHEYQGRKFTAVDESDLDLGDADAAKAGERKKEADKTYADLVTVIQKALADEVSEVRMSTRLTDSVSCLVSGEGRMPPAMERMMKAMNQEVPKTRRILELNPNHPLLARMQAAFGKDPGDAMLADYAGLIYDQALLTEGAPVRNPARFAKLLSELMVKAAGS
jgi:molecular chaperone HtpG